MDKRAYDKAWRRSHPERARAATRRWAKTHRGYWAEYSRLHKQQKAARTQFSNALYRGDIVRPEFCARCGKPCKPHGHHPDYSKPLEVIWLCYACHLVEHGKQSLPV